MEYAHGIRTIKEINPDYFYMLINVDNFSKWLNENKAPDGFIAVNLHRNNSDYFFMTKAELKEKWR